MKYIWVLLLLVSCTAWRTLKWLTPNTNDNKKFAAIKINKSLKPFYFQLDSDIISNRRKKMYDFLLKGTHTNSFLIIHQQKIAYQYFSHNNNTSNTHMLFLISKSIVSSL
ncbi:MAG: hypothetical protein HQ463_00965 [Bacteroidetes bacterium]|nr:hypothetical protein [Bacteroidota bacterium]